VSNPLDQLTKQHDFLVAIDSDGCAFDSMEIKHKECFIPNFIKYFGLQPVSRFAREACEFTNLYSKTRGANRFKAYTLALTLLEDRAEVQARGVEIPKVESLRAWIKRETKLSSGTCAAEAELTGDAEIKNAAEWSAAVDATVKELVENVPPFPLVRESLEKLKDVADIIVCSATPTPALEKEWTEHGIRQFVATICGQEAGSKAEILKGAIAKGYDLSKVIMVGDAPGDRNGARSNNISFYPINPNNEEPSWQRFFDEAADRFLAGTFAGEYEAQVNAEFDEYLPENPPWK
jgi:phosphoglycolate phosphatase-like HAD superfamily hydrolase